MSTEALKDELRKLLGFTAENLLRLAIVVNELENRGEDLSGLRIGLLPILRQIAAGALIPEAVVAFAGQPDVIRRVSKLPVAEQHEIVSGKRTLPVHVPKAAKLHNGRGTVPSGYVKNGSAPAADEHQPPDRHQRPDPARQIGEKAAALLMSAADKELAIQQCVETLIEAGQRNTLLDAIYGPAERGGKPCRSPSVR